MREKFRRYVQTLRDCAESHGVKGVPFLINIHGTGGGRGLTFPIGISQLFETYRNQPQMTSGSDLYLGDLTVSNVADLYLGNAFMQAMHDQDQPLTSLEFEVGNGNYGDDLGMLYAPEAAELKVRLCIAQGNRLLNFYIHCGGENPWMVNARGDKERIAITGQRHGYAAPIDPEGRPNATYEPLGRVTKTLRNLEHLLADSQQEFDDVSLGFVPDHYLTEYRHEASQARREQITDLERFRGAGPRSVLARALLLSGFSFPAVNLQAETPSTGALVLATGCTLARDVQERLVDYVRNGGKLLLVGFLPMFDHDGSSCTVLQEALKLASGGQRLDNVESNVRAHGWAAPRADARTYFVQLLRGRERTADIEPLLTEISNGLACATRVALGEGEVTILGCDYPADLSFYRDLMASLNVVPQFQMDADGPGVVLTSTASGNGRRLLHLINVAPQPVALRLRKNGKKFLRGRRIIVPARAGFILPFGAVDERDASTLAGASIVESTAELVRETRHSFTVRPTQEEDVIVLRTRRRIECKRGVITRTGSLVRVVIDRAQNKGKPVTIRFGRRLRSLS
jgi:beta-galactosidase